MCRGWLGCLDATRGSIFLSFIHLDFMGGTLWPLGGEQAMEAVDIIKGVVWGGGGGLIGH